MTAEQSAPAKGFLNAILGRRGGQVGAVLFLVAIVYLFGVRHMRFFTVPSRSMEPTLLEGDYLATINENTYRRGDVVVIREPDKDEYIVKRIVGLPGDAITVRGQALYIDGDFVSEPYIKEPMQYQIDRPFAVPAETVFVLGDNRNESEDSHVTGETEPLENIVGKVWFIYYPYSRFGSLRSYPAAPLGEQAGHSGE